MLVRDGARVVAGEQLTEGSLNPHRILRILGREACELYLMTEVQKVYRSQGQNINDKHFEVIIRKMLSKVQITQPGDSDLLPGDLVDRLHLQAMNERMMTDTGQRARWSRGGGAWAPRRPPGAGRRPGGGDGTRGDARRLTAGGGAGRMTRPAPTGVVGRGGGSPTRAPHGPQ